VQGKVVCSCDAVSLFNVRIILTVDDALISRDEEFTLNNAALA
jgi:hypothetical protein